MRARGRGSPARTWGPTRDRPPPRPDAGRGAPQGSKVSAFARRCPNREERLTMTLWFLLLFAGVAVLMMALAVPLMGGRVKPNSLYGLRTERTLRDEDAWYRGNAYA